MGLMACDGSMGERRRRAERGSRSTLVVAVVVLVAPAGDRTAPWAGVVCGVGAVKNEDGRNEGDDSEAAADEEVGEAAAGE